MADIGGIAIGGRFSYKTYHADYYPYPMFLNLDENYGFSESQTRAVLIKLNGFRCNGLVVYGKFAGDDLPEDKKIFYRIYGRRVTDLYLEVESWEKGILVSKIAEPFFSTLPVPPELIDDYLQQFNDAWKCRI